MTKLYRLISLCSIIAVLISCQSLQIASKSKRELLEQRVHEYVEARNNQDMDEEYKFFSPSYRQTVSLEQFKERREVKINRVALKSIDYEEDADSARVVLLLDFRVIGFHFEKAKFSQEWRFIDGQWYFKVRPVVATDMFRHPKDRLKETEQ